MSEAPLKSYVNLGCGGRFHPDWLNIDVAPRAPGILVHDLRRGIPLPDSAVEVVYHSHVLEHFRRADAPRFLRECWRVLKAGGLLRVATPDLERIASLYLQQLDRAIATPAAQPDYEWMLLELYDQTVRESSGGQMREFLRQTPLPNEPFVLERIGAEGQEILRDVRSATAGPSRSRFGRVWRRPRLLFEWLRDGLLRIGCGAEAPLALQIGRFRLSGEVHQWMYDRYSLAQALHQAGFEAPTVRKATESAIPNWRRFGLDAAADGTVFKPDSLFMEASKPR